MQKATLEQWRMFKSVADAGGFNQAALVVHKSQSTIHHAVNKLEESLGIKLLTVVGRRSLLTEAGRLMLRRAEYLLEECARIEAVAKSLQAGVETELRLAVDSAFPKDLLYKALDQVSAIYPQLRIDIMETALSGANELTAAARVDIALSPLPMPEGLNEEICNIEFVAVAHNQHALFLNGAELSYENIKSHRQIVVRDSAEHQSVDVGWLGAEQRWTVSHMQASIALLQQGMGFAWLPLPAVSSLLQSGEFKLIPLAEGARRSQSFYLNYQDRDKLGPAAREFMGALRMCSYELPNTELA